MVNNVKKDVPFLHTTTNNKVTSDVCGHDKRQLAKFKEKYFRMAMSCEPQGRLITSDNTQRGVDESFFNVFPENHQL